MVDLVSLGPSRSVSGPRLTTVQQQVAQRQANVGNSAPHNLSLAAALAQLGPPYDADKVALLKAAIANGSYQIDLGNVADGIIRFGGGDFG